MDGGCRDDEADGEEVEREHWPETPTGDAKVRRKQHVEVCGCILHAKDQQPNNHWALC